MKVNLLLVFILIFTLAINATMITGWDFESQSLTPSTGSGTVSLIGGVTHDTYNSGFGESAYAWSTTNYPVQGTNNLTGGILIEVSTVGYSDIYLNWALRHSNTCANREVLFYTLDKTVPTPVWVEAGFYDADDGDTWFTRSFDGRSIPGFNDNANLAFKIVSAFADSSLTQYMPSNPTSTYATTGKWRFDNISIEAITSTPDIGLIINEVCSSNSNVIQSYYSEYSDWIEIKNTTAEEIDLNLYCLSDNENNLLKWRFPVGSSILPGQIIVVWASNRDTTDPSGEFHTSFAISSEGEPIILTFFAGITSVDQMPSVPMPVNVSYGRIGNGSEWYYFTEPTPGFENTTIGYTELLSDPVASVESGWFSSPVSVDFTTSDSLAVIHYTTDGSIPTIESPVWTGAQVLQNRSSEPNVYSMISTVLNDLDPPVSELDMWYPPQTLVPKIHTIKACCFGPGALPSNIVTKVYMVGIDLYEFPIVSISMDPDDLFDDEIGIYVAGNGWDPEHQTHWRDANFMQNWEREAISDWFDAQGNHFLQIQSDIEVHGVYSARAGQKSLRFKAPDLSGPRSLNYPFFGPDYLDHFKHLVLRNSGNDVHFTMFRDNFAQTLLKEQGLDTSNYTPYIVFLDGEFWGIHNLQEHAQEHYIANHYGLDLDELDVLEYHWNVLCGDSLSYQALMDYLEINDESDPAVWQYLETKIDFENYLEYITGEIYTGNVDWPGNNNRYWRKRVEYTPGAPYGEDGRWRWIVYDMDYSFGLYQYPVWSHDTLGRAISPDLDVGWRSFLLRNLITNMDFRNKFINRIADRLNYNFQPNKVKNLVDQFEARNYNTMPSQIERWSFPQTFGLWLGEVNFLRDFADGRPDFVRSTFVDHFSLTGTADIALEIIPPEGAVVRFNNTVDLASGDYVYFQGVPINLKAIVNNGYTIQSFNGVMTDSLYVNPVENQTIQLVLQIIAPQNLTIQRDGEQITLNWDAITGADGYVVEAASTPNAETWEVLEQVSINEYMSVATETYKFYRIRAVYN